VYLRKTAETIGLIAIFIIIGVAISIFSSGILQNGSDSNGIGSQNNGLATYTGYLVSGGSIGSYLGNGNLPPHVSNDIVSCRFADGRTFIANETLAESNHVVANATYTVYYNITEPTVAIDIVKLNSTAQSNQTPTQSP